VIATQSIRSLVLAAAAPVLLSAQTPIFRTDTYAVPVEISVVRDKNPEPNLTAADFTILLDKKPYTPHEARTDPARPGHYLLNFTPPDTLRDGKSHRIEIRVKNATNLMFSIHASCCVWDAGECRGVRITIPRKEQSR